jgi:hypothetical protein
MVSVVWEDLIGVAAAINWADFEASKWIARFGQVNSGKLQLAASSNLPKLSWCA